MDNVGPSLDLRFFFTRKIRAEADHHLPNPCRMILLSLQILSFPPSSGIRLGTMSSDGEGEKTTYLLKIHVSPHATHAAHTTHAAHATHATHAAHTTHTTHAAHATHTTHIEVFLHGLIAVLLILIDPLVKVGLDVRVLCLVLREAGPVFTFEVLFAEMEEEGA